MEKCSFDVEHKTIFVLDHGSYMKDSSNQMVDFDISTKSRPPGVVPLAPVSKSIWSSCIEALCEYCRIVWDIFPGEKLLRFIVSDYETKSLNSWSQDEQTMAYLLKALAEVGPPLKKSDSSVMLGLISAVEAMCDLTKSQKDVILQGNSVQNCGRIICLTQLKNDTHRKALTDCVADAVKRHSELAEKSQGWDAGGVVWCSLFRSSKPEDNMLPIVHLELILVHVKPFSSDCSISELDLTPLKNNPTVLLETHDVKATRHGIAIANRMLNLVRRHYDLSVTSITGIPMKEEQHANSSANYDVLLLHRRLPGTPLIEPERSTWDSELSSTMLLKWCTPKIDVNELFYCTGAARISPVDVNSRPSLCLTNFLLNGRSVSLEHWIKGVDGSAGSSASGSGTRFMTHMISCRGSDIFLHALGVNRCPFDEPPGIADGVGGKVADYRVNEFLDVVKKSQLLPLNNQFKEGFVPLDGAEKNVCKVTRSFPLAYSKTILFNMSKPISPIISTYLQDSLTSEDVLSCQRIIYQLIKYEQDGVSLPVSNSSASSSRLSKHGKRDEQYKALWNELEEFFRSFSDTSPNHQNVMECFLECTGRGNTKKNQKSNEDKRRSGTETSEIFESPESPPPIKKQKTTTETITMRPQKGAQSLLAMWTKRIENVNSQKHVEFYGRLASDGNKAKLYPNIEDDSSTNQATNTQNNDRQRHGHHRFMQHHHRSGSGGREDGGKSGRSTPQGKQKMMKKLPNAYSTPPR